MDAYNKNAPSRSMKNCRIHLLTMWNYSQLTLLDTYREPSGKLPSSQRNFG